MRVEGRLFRDVADAALVGNRIVGEPDARERDVAGARLEQPDDQVDRRALTGSVGPEIADDLAGMEIEADPIEREQAAVPLRQPARLEHCGYRRPRRLGRPTQRLTTIVIAISMTEHDGQEQQAEDLGISGSPASGTAADARASGEGGEPFGERERDGGARRGQ